jgi:hypothetical protein
MTKQMHPQDAIKIARSSGLPDMVRQRAGTAVVDADVPIPSRTITRSPGDGQRPGWLMYPDGSWARATGTADDISHARRRWQAAIPPAG